MDAAQVFTIGQQALYTLLTVAAPVLLAVLVVGILVSIFQAATQINAFSTPPANRWRTPTSWWSTITSIFPISACAMNTPASSRRTTP